MNRLVLFDIDKTLVDRMNPDTGKFHDCIEKVYGIRGKKLVTHGKTDQQIIIEILRKEKMSHEDIMKKIDECKKEMIKYYKRNINKFDYIVYDGVVKLLAALQRKKIPVGIVTGNLEAIAFIKLRKSNLTKFFTLGGFGSDAIHRHELISIAIRRAEKKFGRFEKVFVVGDSPRDIRAGRKAGTTTIGVATGVYPMSALKMSGADHVLPNLKNTEKIIGIILR